MIETYKVSKAPSASLLLALSLVLDPNHYFQQFFIHDPNFPILTGIEGGRH